MFPLATKLAPKGARSMFAPTVLLLVLLARLAHGAPVIGFVEHWPTGSLQGWGGGDFYANPGTGGVLGAGDGYLTITTPGPTPFFSTNLGAFSQGLEYTGDWQAAGIKQVRFWLNDIGASDPLEIHFAIGDAINGNFWQCNTGFIPPPQAWAQFTVDLTTPANFTHIINNPPGGTYNQALQNVNRVLIRHDHAPYVQSPDGISADVGVDELLLTDGVVGIVEVGPPGRVAAQPIKLAPPYPNPSRGAVALSLETFEVAPIHIEVVDVTGRLVRHAILPAASAGLRLWTWDGRGDSGESAPAGYYRVRAFGPSGGTSRPLTRLAGAR
ncbi:MAG: hypothetical protein HYR73_08980 [Candidatus Eisenbacteria bacterium]|nr:hypothetical protein [Candidatus Eisenbacteria bacterium]